MRFSHEYSKLKKQVFTTIRRNSGYYRIGGLYGVDTPEQSFTAVVIDSKLIVKTDIDEALAHNDADMSAKELIGILERWYGKKYDDFVLLTLEKENN